MFQQLQFGTRTISYKFVLQVSYLETTIGSKSDNVPNLSSFTNQHLIVQAEPLDLVQWTS